MYSFGVAGTFLGAPLHVVSGVTAMELRQSVGGGLTLYAATRAGGGLMAIDVTTGMVLRDYVEIATNSTLSASSRLSVMDVGGEPAVILTGPNGAALGGYRLQVDGSLGAVMTVPGGAGAVVTAQACMDVGGVDYVYLTPQGTNALVVGRLTAGGAMTTVQTVALGASQGALDIAAMVPVVVGGQQYLVTVSQARTEMVTYAVGADGTLAQATVFGVEAGFWVATPTALTTVEVAGTTFVIAAAAGSSSLTVLRMDAAGALAVTDHVIDTLDTRFATVEAMTTVTLAGRVYVIAGGGDDGVNLFTLLPEGRLVLLATGLNAPGLGLGNVRAITATTSDGGIDVFVSGEAAGITRLRIDPGALAAPITGTAGADTLIGSAAGDQIYGGAGSDSLSGGAGRDLLQDGAGVDALAGGAAADVFVLSADGQVDTITDFEPAVDRIDLSNWGRVYAIEGLAFQSLVNGVSVSFGAETLILLTANGGPLGMADFATADFFGLWHLVPPTDVPPPPPPPGGGAGTDTLMGSLGAETLDGGAGFDLVDYGTAPTGMVIDMTDPAASTGWAAGDVFIGIEAILGSGLADTLRGGATGDGLFGGDGADVIEGRGGDDSLEGGDGDDVLRGGLGADTLLGGRGVDTADYTDATAAVTVDLAAGKGAGWAAGDVLGGIEAVVAGGFADSLLGSAAGDRLSGAAGDDSLFGLAGNDVLSGGDGADWLRGGLGADTLDGGSGADTADYSDGTAGVVVDLANGALNAGAASGDVQVAIEGVLGSGFADTLRGGVDADSLSGGAGGDLLQGRGGADTLIGGDGNDTLRGGAGADALSGGAGFDVADYSDALAGVRVDLANDGLNAGDALGDVFSGIEGVVGSALNDTLRGGQAGEALWGGGGSDDLRGRDGADRLFGGDGDDSLAGDAGADTLDGGAGFDVVVYADLAGFGITIDLANAALNFGDAAGDVLIGIDGIMAGAGQDSLSGDALANTFFGAGGDDLLHGRGGNDLLNGGDGADVLQGGDGSDGLFGGAGNDTLSGDAGADVLDGGDDLDFVSFALSTAGLVIDLAAPVRNRGDAAGDTFINVEGLIGTNAADAFYGDAADNHFSGGIGADTLWGGAGNDTLFGYDGNDSLAGGDGDDLLTGGLGGDRLYGGSGTDTAVYNARNGVGVTVDLSNTRNNRGDARGDSYRSIENVNGSTEADRLLGDAAANSFYGRDGNDSLAGLGGQDILVGGDGDDTIYGGSGVDDLYGGAGTDRFVFVRGDDGDVIHDFSIGQGDRLAFGRSLVATGLDAQGVVNTYASVRDGAVIFDFGSDDIVTLNGTTTLNDLWQCISLF